MVTVMSMMSVVTAMMPAVMPVVAVAVMVAPEYSVEDHINNARLLSVNNGRRHVVDLGHSVPDRVAWRDLEARSLLVADLLGLLIGLRGVLLGVSLGRILGLRVALGRVLG